MTKNILVSALGARPDIIEETVGYVNYEKEDFYQNLPSYSSVQKSLLKLKLLRFQN